MKSLITMALSAYNQERFVEEAIKGTLAQSYSPLEIIISDDCSQDRTYQIIQNAVQDYSGPHSLRINRNEQNLGVTRHVNRIVEMSSGQLIVFASGDDISLPERVEQTYNCWNENGKKALAIFTQARLIDDSGMAHGLAIDEVTPERLSVEAMLKYWPIAYGYGLAISKRLFHVFGPLPEGVLQEDTIIPIRAALLWPLLYIERPLVFYRRHDENLWKAPGLDTMNVPQFMAFLKRHSKSRIAICKCWLQDLDIAHREYPKRDVDFRKYKRLARKKLLEMETEEKLLLSGVVKRLFILFGAFLEGIGFKKLREWNLKYNLPERYLERQKRYFKNSLKI
jgi:glycosyltransferase involved in cell wall biosynthesis